MLVAQGKPRGRMIKGDHPVCAIVTGQAVHAIVILVEGHTRRIVRGVAVRTTGFGERNT